MQDISPFEVSGATGLLAENVNGIYISTSERFNGKIVYLKQGDATNCIYFATDKSWWAGEMTAEVKAGKVTGYAVTEEGLLHPALAKQWRVADGHGRAKSQPVVVSVMVSRNSLEVVLNMQ